MNKTLREILVGLILGDAHIKRVGTNKAFITFEQSKDKIEYFNFVRESLKNEGLNFQETKFYSRNDSRYNKTNESVYMKTENLEELRPLADMFLNADNKKIIPENIKEDITLKSLAYWIMDDGQQVLNNKKDVAGVTLCTDSYNQTEIGLLRQILKDNLGLNTSIHKKNENERIYIKKESLDRIKPELQENMHTSMWYKITKEAPSDTDSLNTSSSINTQNQQSDIGSDFGGDID